LLRFNGAVERDPAIEVWMREHAGELAAIAGRGVKRRLGHGVSSFAGGARHANRVSHGLVP